MPSRHIAFGDSDEAGEPGFGREKIIIALVE
jgi:hypothetical protein